MNHGVSQLEMRSSQPEIVHETYYYALPSQKPDALRVTTAHYTINELFNGHFPSENKTTQRKKKTFDCVDHIVSISHSAKRDLIKLLA